VNREGWFLKTAAGSEAQMEAAPLVGTVADKTGIIEVNQVGRRFFGARLTCRNPGYSPY
jgi:hypothetical protein